uniref:Eukaryotic translation initiation factor 3 subunit G n=1 Tax=Globodera rostochiensis TaxID=31243 RepID=A0A914HRK5_GLORO
MSSIGASNPLGSLSNVGSIGNWVDAVDQETAQKRSEFLKDGIKTVIDYVVEPDGSKSKVIATYKVIRKKVPRVVAERKSWKKFGASKDDGPGPNINTTYVADEVEVQFTNRPGEQDERDEKASDPLLKGQSSKAHCRFCKSDEHWSVVCPYKEMFKDISEEEQPDPDKGGLNKLTAGRYVPPSQRGGAGERSTMTTGTEQRHSDDYTVRITNLPEDSETLEDDLRALFSRAGRIVRFYLARDKSTGRPKGFAFVTFATQMDAEKAIQEINGAKMEHLILKVEWTKPST